MLQVLVKINMKLYAKFHKNCSELCEKELFAA